MAIGWRQQDIAEAGGWATKGEIRETFVRERVFVPTAQRIDEVYQKLCMTRGPSQNSREYAARHHWPPPLAWDNIDDPNELPDGWQRGHETKPKVADDLIVRAVIDGARAPQGISVADRRAVARELTTRGRTASEVALRCGVTREVVEMDLRRTA
jgi:hypothetical protein